MDHDGISWCNYEKWECVRSARGIFNSKMNFRCYLTTTWRAAGGKFRTWSWENLGERGHLFLGPGGTVILLRLGWQSCPPSLLRIGSFWCMKYTDDLLFFHMSWNFESQNRVRKIDNRCSAGGEGRSSPRKLPSVRFALGLPALGSSSLVGQRGVKISLLYLSDILCWAS